MGTDIIMHQKKDGERREFSQYLELDPLNLIKKTISYIASH